MQLFPKPDWMAIEIQYKQKTCKRIGNIPVCMIIRRLDSLPEQRSYWARALEVLKAYMRNDRSFRKAVTVCVHQLSKNDVTISSSGRINRSYPLDTFQS